MAERIKVADLVDKVADLVVTAVVVGSLGSAVRCVRKIEETKMPGGEAKKK